MKGFRLDIVLCKLLFAAALATVFLPGCGGGTSGTGGRQYRGTATNQNGTPIANLNVTLRETGEATRTNRAGVYELDSRLYASRVNLRFNSDNPQKPPVDRTVEVQDVPIRTRAIVVDVVIDEINNELLDSSVKFEIATDDGLLTEISKPVAQRIINTVSNTPDNNGEGGVGYNTTQDYFESLFEEGTSEGFVGSEPRSANEDNNQNETEDCPSGPRVCGVDNLNYRSSCEADSFGVAVAYEGLCFDYSVLDESGSISCLPNPPEYAQRCDTSRNFYPSECLAVFDFGLDRKDLIYCPTPACETDPVCGTLVDCSSETKVCGMDGNTYESKEAAQEAWINVAYHRECIPGAQTVFHNICDGLRCQGPPRLEDRVCGSDGVTYPSTCVAILNGITETVLGECGASQSCRVDPVCTNPGLCPENGEVCGKDNKTYSSLAAAENAGVGVAYHRACIKYAEINLASDTNSCSLKCLGPPALEDQVCGSDGKDYVSECQAFEAGTTVAFYGRCQDSRSCNPDPVCKEGIDCPVNGEVCGKDNITYPNALAANLAGIGVAYNRSCINDSILRPGFDCSVICIGPLPPDSEVCGTDGKTYFNECDAIINGEVSVDYKGSCGRSEDCQVDQVCSVIDCSLSDDVCGKDNKTYESAAQAHAAGVGVAYKRSCLEWSELQGYLKDECAVECSAAYDFFGNRLLPLPPEQTQVCGEDRREYLTECIAYSQGVTPIYKGVCEG